MRLGKRVGARRFAHSHEGLNELKAVSARHCGFARGAGLHCRNEPWLAHYLPAGSWHPGLSGEPEDRQSVAQSGRSQDRPN